MSLIGVKKKIETVKSLGFTVSAVDFDGCLLDSKEHSLRCVINRNRDYVEFKKYYELENERRFVSRFSCSYHFLKDVDNPIEMILFQIERIYNLKNRRLFKFIGINFNESSNLEWFKRPENGVTYDLKDIYRNLYGVDPKDSKKYKHLAKSVLENDKDWLEVF
jgi:hypothetical protein